ncbi:ribosomal protein L6 [Chloropicon primus]|uniref:Ribosomal protein L6 n=1 Tax=Chloropicon primus TaxID=1764295 RepID=A0A5B8MTK1_9CHLO|nr:ribosomal protein L6 [Chloropicon primus]UPR02944.1 ribosomal protein L6 [Chloropicon primus]|eukprot:QDZ23731.1 ribosomal protein L6 [Chloropicon primus]
MRALCNNNVRLTARAARPVRLVTTCKESRIGKRPVQVGKSEVKLEGQVLTVKGPLGTLTREFPPEIALSMSDDKAEVKFTKAEDSKKAKQLHGLCRTLGQNMVTGVLEGWEKKLSLIGVGYRAAMKGSKQIELQLGYIHPVVLDLPEGVKAEVDKSQTAITITGYDKEVVGNFAAVVRSKRPPEVYKGKGIRYADEYVRMKEGKAGKK